MQLPHRKHSESHTQHLSVSYPRLYLSTLPVYANLYLTPIEAYLKHMLLGDIQLIVHSCPRWLLLEAPTVRANFFQKVNKGRIDFSYELILQIFTSFVGLVKQYGYFRPTEKMVFLEGKELRVWFNEDIFDPVPMMPIKKGTSSEKYFVFAFLAMLQTCLDDWERTNGVITIDDTLKMLEWRCRLARGHKTALYASIEVHQQESPRTTFGNDETKSATLNSQQIPSQQTKFQNITPNKSVIMIQRDFQTFLTSFQQGNDLNRQEEAVVVQKKVFALNSTSTTIGTFSEQFRTTAGRRKLMERVESQQKNQEKGQTSIHNMVQTSEFELEVEGLFAGETCNNDDLERIAEEMQGILEW